MTTPTLREAAQAAIDALELADKMANSTSGCGHLYEGDCPDDSQPEAFDPACPACKLTKQARATAATLRAAIAAQPAPEAGPLWLYRSLCDLVDEAGAFGTVMERPEQLREKLATVRDAVGAAPVAQPAPAVAQHGAGPAGWFEGPHGAFRANPAYRIQWPPQSVKWQIPLYVAIPAAHPKQPTAQQGAKPLGWAHAGALLSLKQGATYCYVYAAKGPGASQPVYSAPLTAAQQGAALTDAQIEDASPAKREAAHWFKQGATWARSKLAATQATTTDTGEG